MPSIYLNGWLTIYFITWVMGLAWNGYELGVATRDTTYLCEFQWLTLLCIEARGLCANTLLWSNIDVDQTYTYIAFL